MALFFDRVAFMTATTGTGTVNVGAAITDSFLTPAEAGAENSDSPIPYLILDGADFEIGVGTYNTGSPPTFSRDTVTSSKIGGTVGTSKINLSGEAQVRFAHGADELSAIETLLGTAAQLDVEDQVLAGGARVTSKPLGTAGVVSSGTVTPDPGDRPHQHYTNGGAHTLAPGSNAGSYLLDITNNSSAGAITTSGWTLVDGDSFTTTDGHKFRCHCSIGEAGSLLSVKAMQ